MTDGMERIWAEDPDIFDDMGMYYTSEKEGLVEYVRGDIVQRLIEENIQLRAALNQSRLAFAGYVSVQSAIDLIDRITPREDKSAK